MLWRFIDTGTSPGRRAKSELWADFTYIWTAEGWLHAAAVLDHNSRHIGWSMQESTARSWVGPVGTGHRLRSTAATRCVAAGARSVGPCHMGASRACGPPAGLLVARGRARALVVWDVGSANRESPLMQERLDII